MNWAERLRALFGGLARAVPPPPPPPAPPGVGVRVGPHADPHELLLPPLRLDLLPARRDTSPEPPPSAEAWQARPAEELATDLTCTIGYVDGQGEESVRRISVRKILRRDGRTYLVSFCHERQAIRHFLLDRVQECWDCDTGEVIDLAAWIATLAPAPPKPDRARGRPKAADERLPGATERPASGTMIELELRLALPDDFVDASRRDASPESGTEIRPRSAPRRALVDRCGDGLRVLRFIALCDGRSAPEEEAVSVNYARRCCDGRAIGLPAIEFDREFAQQFYRRLRPTPQSMLEALARVLQRCRAPEISLLVGTVADVILADGRVHRHEEHFMGELRRILKELAPAAERALAQAAGTDRQPGSSESR